MEIKAIKQLLKGFRDKTAQFIDPPKRGPGSKRRRAEQVTVIDDDDDSTLGAVLRPHGCYCLRVHLQQRTQYMMIRVAAQA